MHLLIKVSQSLSCLKGLVILILTKISKTNEYKLHFRNECKSIIFCLKKHSLQCFVLQIPINLEVSRPEGPSGVARIHAAPVGLKNCRPQLLKKIFNIKQPINDNSANEQCEKMRIIMFYRFGYIILLNFSIKSQLCNIRFCKTSITKGGFSYNRAEWLEYTNAGRAFVTVLCKCANDNRFLFMFLSENVCIYGKQ